LLIAIAAACGKGGGVETVPLGETGYVVDVPKGWTIESEMKGFYGFKHQHGAPQIMESPIPAPSIDEIVKSRCEGREVVSKEALPSGGAIVTCKGESKMVKGITTTQIATYIPYGDKSFSCHLETDRDPADAIAICKSIRKK
jgi:hypothetical protein